MLRGTGWLNVLNQEAPDFGQKAPKKAPTNFYKKRHNLGQKHLNFDPLIIFFAFLFKNLNKKIIFINKLNYAMKMIIYNTLLSRDFVLLQCGIFIFGVYKTMFYRYLILIHLDLFYSAELFN